MIGSDLDRVRTARLELVRPRPEHADDHASLLGDPRVAKTLSRTTEPPTEAEIAANLDAKLKHWDMFGFGFWMLYDLETGAFAGRGGLQHTLATGLDEVELGWAIVPERWGQGLATELALASVAAGFQTLDLRELVAFTMVGNLASRRVMEKAGLSYEREFSYVGLPHVLYRLGRC